MQDEVERRKWSRAIAPLFLLASLSFLAVAGGYRSGPSVEGRAALAFLVLSIGSGILARQWVFVSVVLGTIACWVGLFLLVQISVHRPSEPAAVQNLRTINTAQVVYLSSYGGRYGTIEDLVGAQLLDDTFTGAKAGYNYSITLNPTRSEYTAEAVPASASPDRYGYYSVEDAVVRYSMNPLLAPAGQTGKSVP